eukprot:CAMPEP_0203677440 /NCGR_PEP_ID=MMETSP0090-20130426/28222_1 /ASSEMBLY_ACC=CAM_ASM_001088 /TAXON_ID=426623 /ORGANISM="Chaetoceros affinis, Strain CCMP159" /LENGTH=223 /DNA_ID=CAMNT_0050544333 /DNA_START=315 /DNA_END=986 /DNA_ORIENTATION=-
MKSARVQVEQPLHLLQMTGSNSTVATSSTAMEGEKKDEVRLRASPIKKKMPAHDVGGPVEPISSVDGFLGAIEGAPKDCLVVVLYHAKWCKVCARVTVKMRQMAQRMEKKGTPCPVKFISVEVTANNEICSTLGIKKFPFIQMYRNRECVASFGTGPAHNFQKAVGGTLDEKFTLTEDQWDNFRTEFKKEISEGLDKLDSLKISNFLENDGIDTKAADDDLTP